MEQELSTSKNASTSSSKSDAARDDLSAAHHQTLRAGFDRSVATLMGVSVFGKDSLDAWVASATAAKAGFDAVSSRATAFQKQTAENHMTAAYNIMASKNVQELVHRQTEYVQNSLHALQTELAAMSQLITSAATNTASPLSERVAALRDLVQPANATR